jgi:hypothetical protein
MALPVVAVGVLGLMDGAWLRTTLATPNAVQAVFGILLCAWVLSAPTAADPAQSTRRLIRMVYLLLYVIIGISGTIGLIGRWCGGTFHPADQVFLAYGIVGLLMARVPGYVKRLRERAA